MATEKKPINVFFNGSKIESFNGVILPVDKVKNALLPKHPYLEGSECNVTEEGYYFSKKAKTLG